MNIIKKATSFLINSCFQNRNTEKELKNNSFILLRNKIFKNRHKDKRAFIIGNGASLKDQNLFPLKKEITFAMNAFWKHPVISKDWQPMYYCFADPVTFDGSSVWKDFFDSLRKKINRSTFFIPFLGKKVIKKHKLLLMDKTYYVSFEAGIKLNKGIDLTSHIPSVQSTAQLALEIAIYMGCNPIYLMGMDHDWLAHRGLDRHFYSDETIKGHSGVISDLSKTTYKSELESCLRLWNKYEDLAQIAKLKGIQIFNATEGGFLDVFERKKYETVVSGK